MKVSKETMGMSVSCRANRPVPCPGGSVTVVDPMVSEMKTIPFPAVAARKSSGSDAYAEE